MAIEGVKLGSGVRAPVFGDAARGIIIGGVIIRAGGIGVGTGILIRRYGVMDGRTRGVGLEAGWPGLDQNGLGRRTGIGGGELGTAAGGRGEANCGSTKPAIS